MTSSEHHPFVVPADTERWIRQLVPWSGHTVQDAAEYARSRDWAGLGVVLDAAGSPLSLGDADNLLGQHSCLDLLETVNAETAQRRIAAVAGDHSVGLWAGVLSYDASMPRAQQVAEEIAMLLGEYACLDEATFSQRQHDAAVARLGRDYQVPALLIPEVIRRLQEGGGLCEECHAWDVDRIMAELRYRRCADCVLDNPWISTTQQRPLHAVCADPGAASSRGSA